MKKKTINEPIFSIINRKNPVYLQTFKCTNNLKWGVDCDCFFDLINSDYPFLHKHSYFEIGVFISGSLTNFLNGTAIQINVGDCFLVRPDDEHAIYSKIRKENTFYINFVITIPYIKKIFSIFGENIYDFILSDKKPLKFKINNLLLTEIVNECYEIQIVNRTNTLNAQIHCKALVNILINEFVKQKIIEIKEKPAWLNDLINYLNIPDSFNESIEVISAKTPYSYSRLSHLFKEWFGITIIDYRNKIKLEYSKKLIENGDKNVSEIANFVGFDSLSYFTHLFKNAYNITPSEYKRKYLESLKNGNLQML